MEKFEITKAFEDFTTRLKALDKVLNIEEMKQEIKNNEQKMLDAAFWNDAKTATSFVQHNNEMKETINTFESLCKTNEEIEMILELDDISLYCNLDIIFISLLDINDNENLSLYVI